MEKLSKESRYKNAKKAAFIGIWGNIFLGIIKLFAGVFGHSTAVIADSVHSFSDVLTSVVCWIGVKLGKKRPDKYHPYGHGDAEPIAGLIISMILGMIGFEIARESATEIVLGQFARPGVVAVYITIFAIAFKYWIYKFTIDTGRKIKSNPVIADAYHHKSDFYTSLVVLLGVSISMLNKSFLWLDPFAGFFVALWIIKIGFDLGRKNIKNLMGEMPTDDVASHIRHVAESVDGVKGVHNIRIHYIGPYSYVSLHVNVDKGLTIKDAHEIATNVESRIRNDVSDVSFVSVHMEPA